MAARIVQGKQGANPLEKKQVLRGYRFHTEDKIVIGHIKL
jgi:hypothetical protein